MASRLFYLLPAVVASLPAAASAHSISRSFSRWTFSGAEVQVAVTIPVVELARLNRAAGGLSAAAIATNELLTRWTAAYVVPRVRVADRSARCRPASRARFGTAGPTRVTLRWLVRCAEAPGPGVAVDLFFDGAPAHLHFVLLTSAEGEAVGTREALLDVGRRRAVFSGTPGKSSSGHAPGGVLTYVAVGLEHVLSGHDHLAFVIGLLLLGGRLWTLIKIATGFTLGHSLTLALAAAGLVNPQGGSVEIMVGLSIAYVALEAFHHWLGSSRSGRLTVFGLLIALHLFLLGLSLWGRTLLPWPLPLASMLFFGCHMLLQQRHGATPRIRLVVALLFGLIHGFAFAGALGEIFSGADLVRPLLGFNVGVEMGQAAVILALLPLLWLARRFLGQQGRGALTGAAAAAILILGLNWTLVRALTFV